MIGCSALFTLRFRGTAAETARRLFGAIGLAGALLLIGAAPTVAQNILTVTAGPDSLLPNPVDAGIQSVAHLTANVSNPPQPQQEETINGPVWGWTVTNIQFQAPGSSTWTDTFAYCNPMVAVPDYSVPDAGLYVTFFRAGSWIVTLKVTVDYSDPAPNGPTWHGEATENITATCDLNATLLVRRGMNPFSTSAIVAAGGVGDVAHMADVLVQTTPAVGGIYVDAPVITNGAGQLVNAAIAPNGTTTGNTGQTDFTFTSSDVVQAVTLSLAGSSATINQHWDDISDSSDWSYDPCFDLAVPSPIVFSPQFQGNDGMIPITGHLMEFFISDVTSTLTDPNTGEITTFTYQSTDPTAANYQPDLSSYTFFEPMSVADSGGGVYQSSLTLIDDTVDSFGFNVYDTNAWH